MKHKKSLAIISVIALFGCNLNSCNPHVVRDSPTKQKTLVIGISDLSLSTQYTDTWDTSSLANIYSSIASHGGGTLKFFFIKANSLQQTGISINISSLDTVNSANASLYKAGKAKSANKKIRDDFSANSAKALSSLYQKVLIPRTEKFSDCYGCLQLSKITCEQSNYNDYRVFVIINSDLIQDVYKQKSIKQNFSFQFPDNVKILLVRPAISASELKQLFSTSEVDIYTSLQDAISSINQY